MPWWSQLHSFPLPDSIYYRLINCYSSAALRSNRWSSVRHADDSRVCRHVASDSEGRNSFASFDFPVFCDWKVSTILHMDHKEIHNYYSKVRRPCYNILLVYTTIVYVANP